MSDDQIMLRHDASASLVSYRSEARHCDVIHLACHGRLEEPAANSRLYLAPEPPDDGLLLAREVSEVPLDDALVFLSACETGLGWVRRLTGSRPDSGRRSFRQVHGS